MKLHTPFGVIDITVEGRTFEFGPSDEKSREIEGLADLVNTGEEFQCVHPAMDKCFKCGRTRERHSKPEISIGYSHPFIENLAQYDAWVTQLEKQLGEP